MLWYVWNHPYSFFNLNRRMIFRNLLNWNKYFSYIKSLEKWWRTGLLFRKGKARQKPFSFFFSINSFSHLIVGTLEFLSKRVNLCLLYCWYCCHSHKILRREVIWWASFANKHHDENINQSINLLLNNDIINNVVMLINNFKGIYYWL